MLSPKDAIRLRTIIIRQLRDKNRTDEIIKKMKVCGELGPDGNNKAIIELYLTQISRVAALAQPIVWNLNIWNAAVRDADKVFPEIKINLEAMNTSSSGSQLWLFQGIHFENQGPEEWGFNREMSLDAILVLATETQIDANLFFAPTNGWNLDEIPCHEIRRFGVATSGQRADGRYASICAALYFLGLKLTKLESYKPTPKIQKSLKKEGYGISDIKIIALRKYQSTSSKDHRLIDWQHQWLVSGHWRKQWFPSSNEHKPVYIQPYLKGPEDKPMMPIRETIYKAIR